MKAAEALRLSGINLQTVRLSKDFSIEALAVLSGVDAEKISMMEAGDFNFSISTVYELAAALNVDFRKILVDPTSYGAV